MILPPNSLTASAKVNRSPLMTTYDSPSSGVRFSLAAGVVDPNHRSSMPPRLRPNAYKSFGSSLSRLPGWRNDRGTQHGASRSSPPPSDRADSTRDLTLLETVLSCLTEVGAAMCVGPCVMVGVWKVRPPRHRGVRAGQNVTG